MEVEFNVLWQRGVFKKINRNAIGGKQVIPLTWVFKYKFDEDGFCTKFKARVCVRGDLQITFEETYAATLAGRTFRALIALIAAFNLVARQFDALNAFINARMINKVYCA
jgi:hypothetical protein